MAEVKFQGKVVSSNPDYLMVINRLLAEVATHLIKN
jgi:hypothetical protein